MEVEEFVLEDEGDYGVYLIDGQIRKSPTSELSYSWGVDKNQIRTQHVEPGTRAVIREVKRRAAVNEKPLSQEEAIQVALAGIKAHKDQYTGFGREMHEAFKAFDLAQPLNLPTPKHEAYFQGFLYFQRQYPSIKPISDKETGEPFIEKFISCPHCELSTQIDKFAEVDGLNTIIDYKTGRTIGYAAFQLAIYKHVLEHLGYRVDRTWAVHVQHLFAFPIETNKSWDEVELRLKNAEMKRRELNPKTFVREFSGEKKQVASETLTTVPEHESAQDLNIQGHQSQREVQDSLSKSSWKVCEDCRQPVQLCLCPGDIPHREKVVTEYPFVVQTQKRPRGRPRKDQAANTSSHTAAIQPRTRPEEAELDPKHLHPTRLKREFLERAA